MHREVLGLELKTTIQKKSIMLLLNDKLFDKYKRRKNHSTQNGALLKKSRFHSNKAPAAFVRSDSMVRGKEKSRCSRSCGRDIDHDHGKMPSEARAWTLDWPRKKFWRTAE
jgi:hypothetical protein